MSLKPAPIEPVPEQTARIARAAFPKGNSYLTLRDELGTLYRDEDFAGLFSQRGQPALPPWRLALITILQFHENLSDRQAAQAVRARIDWKYLLGLELTDPGFHYSVLCEFRARLNRWQRRDAAAGKHARAVPRPGVAQSGRTPAN
jgi:transposase